MSSMPRTKVSKRTRQQLRQEAEHDDLVRMANIKLDSALSMIDGLGKRAQQQINDQLHLMLARTHKDVLQMKWSDFLQLKLDHFEDFKWIAPAGPKTRSQSISLRSGRLRTPNATAASRTQVQSVDRAVLRNDDLPAMAYMRWPKPGEVALSKRGSPLAMQGFPDRCANVHIPTKVGVLKLNPQKISDVQRELFTQLDSRTLDQIKTLNSNLHMIVDMAAKMRKF